jgi:predicted metal-dependent hydrolase
MEPTEIIQKEDFDVRITRKRVRRVNLKVRAGDAEVCVSAPVGYPTSGIEAFVDEKYDWIVRNRRRVLEASRAEARRWDEGGTVSLLGEDLAICYSMDAQTKRAQRVERQEQSLVVHLADFLAPEDRAAEARRLVEAWLRTSLEELLPSLFERFQRETAITCSGWRVRRMKTRWGSCNTKTRVITINAQLVEYPPECLESVIVHELCHLLEPSHNARFHQLLDAYYPRNRDARKILNQTPPRR